MIETPIALFILLPSPINKDVKMSNKLRKLLSSVSFCLTTYFYLFFKTSNANYALGTKQQSTNLGLMATRDCLGKIRWVRRLPVHTLVSLETVKYYQLLTFSKSGPPSSQPPLSSSVPSRPIMAWPCPDTFVRTDFQLTFCKGSLIGCLINDSLYSFFLLG